jgi:hypothetical protein
MAMIFWLIVAFEKEGLPIDLILLLASSAIGDGPRCSVTTYQENKK